jgi:hypothetical protein
VPPRLLLLNLVVVSWTGGPDRSYQMGMSFPAIRPRSGAAEAVAHLGRTTTVGSSAPPLLDPELRPALLVLGAAAPTRPWAARCRLPTSELPAEHPSRPRRPHAAAGVRIPEPRGTAKRSEKGTDLPELECEVQSSSASLPRLAPGAAGTCNQ